MGGVFFVEAVPGRSAACAVLLQHQRRPLGAGQQPDAVYCLEHDPEAVTQRACCRESALQRCLGQRLQRDACPLILYPNLYDAACADADLAQTIETVRSGAKTPSVCLRGDTKAQENDR